MNEQRVIGLTGGIATGKSTVANYLRDIYHLPLLDADIYARDAVATDKPIYREILMRYGDRIILPDRSLDRLALGEIIFNDPAEKNWLEGKIHPYVVDRIKSEIARSDSPTIILAIPLLFEANLTYLVTEIWVVACSLDRQLQRLQQRDKLVIEQAKARISSQLPLESKIAAADVVLDNNDSKEKLYRQIDIALKDTKTVSDREATRD